MPLTDDQAKLYTAQWVAPMDGPLLREAGVLTAAGKVLAVGPARDLHRLHPQAAVHDLGAAVILPGLINAHVHLELSHLKPGPAPSGFTNWLLGLLNQGQGQPPPPLRESIETGIHQCLRFGVTSVGDITTQPTVTRPLLAMSRLSGVSYGEVRAMAQRRRFLAERIEAAATPVISPRWQAGISPHAPYSVETDGYSRCLLTARLHQLPLATHLAEDAAEAEFLSDQTGPFRTLWSLLNAWDESVPRFKGGPIRLADSLGLLQYPTLLAHVNVVDDAELDLLARGRASVVYCPRTHRYFNRPPHRFRQMLARGINVAVGTDSCASSADLNLVDDLRLIHMIAPEIPAAAIWEMATTRAATALKLKHRGTLSPGATTAMAVFPATTDDPLLELLENSVMPIATITPDG